MTARITPFEMSDYDAAVSLWRDAEGVVLGAADDRDAIARFLAHNDGLSFVARRDGRLVGAALCGCDGRRADEPPVAARYEAQPIVVRQEARDRVAIVGGAEDDALRVAPEAHRGVVVGHLKRRDASGHRRAPSPVNRRRAPPARTIPRYRDPAPPSTFGPAREPLRSSRPGSPPRSGRAPGTAS